MLFTIIKTLNYVMIFIHKWIIKSFDLCAFNLFFTKKPKNRRLTFFWQKRIQAFFFWPKNLSFCKKSKKSNERIWRKLGKMAKNDRKQAKNRCSDFFWKKNFCYFFVTYQGLTRCKKSKKSNERILRLGEQTNERTDKRKD